MERHPQFEQEVLGTMRRLLREFHVAEEKVVRGAEFEALGMDSLDLVELSVKVEDAYGIDIEEDDLEQVKSVGDACSLVVRKIGAKV